MPVPVPSPVVSVSSRTSGWLGFHRLGQLAQAVELGLDGLAALYHDDGAAGRGQHDTPDIRGQPRRPLAERAALRWPSRRQHAAHSRSRPSELP